MKDRLLATIYSLLDTFRLFVFVSIFTVEKIISGFVNYVVPSKRYVGFHLSKRLGRSKKASSISIYNLVSIAFRQVFYRRSRAYVTIGAIAFAMGTIVLLVSLGYGAQNTVVNRVADDRELSVIDILPEAGKRVVLDPAVVKQIIDLDDVANILPLVSVVGTVDYEGSDTDIVAYGVTADYIEISETVIDGEIFDFNEIPQKSVKYVVEEELPSTETSEEVNGASTDILESAPLEFVDVEVIEEEEVVSVVEIKSEVPFEALVNSRFLAILGIDQNDAIGKSFEVSFVPVKDLIGDGSDKVISNKVKYTIIGVVDGDSQPIVYIPLDHIWSMGAVKFSQARVVTTNSSKVEDTREKLESMGMVTKSIVDTIDQIESFFAIVRVVLLIIGLGALVIASLGMFNTLTVSLLERSREIGLLKVMGMKSNDVYRLFITESLIMGVWGGIGGISLAFIGGKFLSLVLSAVTLSRGGEFVDISYIPFSFLVISLCLIILVGILTGVYPAKRATTISAIDALRYE